MKYAVIRTGGKQYKISEGDVIGVERLSPNGDKHVTFSEVLLYAADNAIKLGKPIVDGVLVKGLIVDEKKQKKIRVLRFKSKVRYRRVTGHRQIFSMVQIQEISPSSKKVEKKAEIVEKEPAKKPRAKATASAQ